LEKKKINKKQGRKLSEISEMLSGDKPLTPDYLQILCDRGIIGLEMKDLDFFLDVCVRKAGPASADKWTRVLNKLKSCGFLEIVRGEWCNSWANNKWSSRITY
jgi:hypothetical protein